MAVDMRAPTLALTIGAFASMHAEAQDLSSVSRGLAYATQVCSDCHAVTPEQAHSPDPKAPTFQTVANISGMTRIALGVWLHSPHPTMPQLIVDTYRIDDLAAYIATLKHK